MGLIAYIATLNNFMPTMRISMTGKGPQSARNKLYSNRDSIKDNKDSNKDQGSIVVDMVIRERYVSQWRAWKAGMSRGKQFNLAGLIPLWMKLISRSGMRKQMVKRQRMKSWLGCWQVEGAY